MPNKSHRVAGGFGRNIQTGKFIGDYIVRLNNIETYIDGCIATWLGHHGNDEKNLRKFNNFTSTITPSISLGRKQLILNKLLEDVELTDKYPDLVKRFAKNIELRNKLAHGSDLVRERDLQAAKKTELPIRVNMKGSIFSIIVNPNEEMQKLNTTLDLVLKLRDDLNKIFSNDDKD